jgi:hypothetical protein
MQALNTHTHTHTHTHSFARPTLAEHAGTSRPRRHALTLPLPRQRNRVMYSVHDPLNMTLSLSRAPRPPACDRRDGAGDTVSDRAGDAVPAASQRGTQWTRRRAHLRLARTHARMHARTNYKQKNNGSVCTYWHTARSIVHQGTSPHIQKRGKKEAALLIRPGCAGKRIRVWTREDTCRPPEADRKNMSECTICRM